MGPPNGTYKVLQARQRVRQDIAPTTDKPDVQVDGLQKQALAQQPLVGIVHPIKQNQRAAVNK